MITKLLELFKKEEQPILPMGVRTIYPDIEWNNVADYQQMIRVGLTEEVSLNDYSTRQRGYAKPLQGYSESDYWSSHS